LFVFRAFFFDLAKKSLAPPATIAPRWREREK
jgi:hypothetical protein